MTARRRSSEPQLVHCPENIIRTTPRYLLVDDAGLPNLRRLGPPAGMNSTETYSGQLVEEEINGGNPAVAGDDEIRPGVCWRIAGTAGYPWDPPALPASSGSAIG